MGRQLRNSLPQVKSHLVPSWPDLDAFRRKDEEFKNKQAQNYDRRHAVQRPKSIPPGAHVWIKSSSHPVKGQVTSQAHTPRSYWVVTPTGGVLRRNTRHLTPDYHSQSPLLTPPKSSDPDHEMIAPSESHKNIPPRSPIMTRSRTGTQIDPPKRFQT